MISIDYAFLRRELSSHESLAKARHCQPNPTLKPKRPLHRAMSSSAISSTIPAAPSTTMLCSPGHVPTMLPGVNASLNWCATPGTNATNSTMTTCCAQNPVHILNGCAWCAAPETYLNTTNGDSDTTQTLMQQDFASCLSRAAVNRNFSQNQALYCNAPNLPTSSALRLRLGGQRFGWLGVATLFVFLSGAATGSAAI